MDWLLGAQASLYGQLLGALVGLARATDGNEHMLSDTTVAAAVEGLRLLDDRENRDEGLLSATIARIREEKRKLVPDCFHCACPCGRTFDYDVDSLRSDREEIRDMKGKVLSALCALAGAAATQDTALASLFYRALFSLGCDDYEAEDYIAIAVDLEKAVRK